MTIAPSPKNPIVAYKYITTFNARHIVINTKITKIENNNYYYSYTFTMFFVLFNNRHVFCTISQYSV